MQRDRHSLWHTIPEWARYLAERLLVLPAAHWLPRMWAMRVADAIGWVEARLPIEGTRVARAEMRAAGVPDSRVAAAVSEHLAWPRRNLVIAKRLRLGKERVRDWRIVEEGGDRVHALHDAGERLLVVSAHFVDTAGFVVNTHIFPELAGSAVTQVNPPFAWSPFVLRTRMVNSLIYGLARFLAEPGRERRIPFVGQGGVVDRVVHQMNHGVPIAKILIDAFWEKPNAHRRPFAGMPERGFALGAARIARAAQCHVTVYTAVFEENAQTVRVIWRDPIPPPAAANDADADIPFMDALIDELERSVGDFPAQYLHPMGHTRRWDSATRSWR